MAMPDDSLSARDSEVLLSDAAADWLACQREAEDWIAPDGTLIEDPTLRNRRISAAYASLWLADRRLQWAGLAAFASKQVGCDMLHAGAVMQRLGGQIRASHVSDNFEWLYKVMIPALVGAGAGYLRGQLSLGNLTVFLDVYPLHRFYAKHGLDKLRSAIGARSQLAERVHWPVPSQVIPFGKPFREIVEAFTLADSGRLADSVLKLAWHEQVNVLQSVIYDDPKTRLALDSNQLGASAGLHPDEFAPIELPFSAACRAQPDATTIFSPLQNAHLYDVGQRMDFVARSAFHFDTLLHGAGRLILEDALYEIQAAGLS
jgi:hypothetical protein